MRNLTHAKILLSALLIAIFHTGRSSNAGAATSGDNLVKPNSAASSPATSTANSSSPGSANSGKSADASTIDSIKDDSKITIVPTPRQDAQNRKIMNSLIAQAGWFPDVKVTVVDGMVTIEGQATNREQLDWLAKTADRLPSVVAVINKAHLLEPPLTDFSPAWKEFKILIERAKKALPAILLTALLLTLFFFAGQFVSRGVESLWRRRISNPFLLSTVAKITMLPIWLMSFYFALEIAGLSNLATTIVGGTGVIGIVVGFAFKDIAENYLSGLLLAFRSPFTKGDLIKVADFLGYVQGLEMRGTTIIDFDGNLILIPNTIVIKSVIENLTATPQSRLSFGITISYNDSVTKAQELVEASLLEIEEILKEPPPLVIVDQVAGGNVNLKVFFWYDAATSSSLRVKSKAISRAKEILIANGIGVPDGTTTIKFGDALKILAVPTRADLDSEDQAKKDQLKEKASSNLEDSKSKSKSVDLDQAHRQEVEKLFGWANQTAGPMPKENLVNTKTSSVTGKS